MKIPRKAISTICISIAGVGIVLSVWVIFFSKLFIIEYIDIKDTTLDAALIRMLAFQYMDENSGISNQRNILFFRTKQFRNYLSQYIVIDEIDMKKKYPDRLLLSIRGSPFHVIGYADGRFFEVSPQGFQGREVDPVKLAMYPTLIQKYKNGERISLHKKILKKIDLSVPVILMGPQSIENNERILTPEIVSHIEAVKKNLRDEKYSILFFQIEPSGHEYRAFTHEGWNMIFTSESDPIQATTQVKTLINTTIKKKRKVLDYIDARFANRMYYTLHP